jgi:hypothetical protein
VQRGLHVVEHVGLQVLVEQDVLPLEMVLLWGDFPGGIDDRHRSVIVCGCPGLLDPIRIIIRHPYT